ncbi:IclR family transcriptional regulator [Coraliomargarita sp. W4R53]
MTVKPGSPALDKAISILKYLGDRNEPIFVKELIYALDIPPASCYRIVNTLIGNNWLREEPSGGLRIAFGLAHVARAFSEIETRLRELEPSLRRLAKDLQLSVKVSLREGYYASVALKAEPTLMNAISSSVGSRIHLAVGSAGAALLSLMPDPEIQKILDSASDEVWQRQTPQKVWERVQQCRERGTCCDLGCYHPSIYALSAPLITTNSLMMVLTAVGWEEDFAGEKLDAIRVQLKDAVMRFGEI